MADAKEIDVHEKHAQEAQQSDTGMVAELSHFKPLHQAFKL
jgi:hypothetical protein